MYAQNDRLIRLSKSMSSLVLQRQISENFAFALKSSGLYSSQAKHISSVIENQSIALSQLSKVMSSYSSFSPTMLESSRIISQTMAKHLSGINGSTSINTVLTNQVLSSALGQFSSTCIQNVIAKPGFMNAYRESSVKFGKSPGEDGPPVQAVSPKELESALAIGTPIVSLVESDSEIDSKMAEYMASCLEHISEIAASEQSDSSAVSSYIESLPPPIHSTICLLLILIQLLSLNYANQLLDPITAPAAMRTHVSISRVADFVALQSDTPQNLVVFYSRLRYVNVTELVLRSHRSTSAAGLYDLQYGTTIKVLEYDKEWAKVSLTLSDEVVTGWVKKKYISKFDTWAINLEYAYRCVHRERIPR